jgi:peptide/nickel transport system permease protein
MLYFAQNSDAFFSGAWWWYVPPGLCVALVGMGLALTNLGIDEIINPKLRASLSITRKQRRRFARDERRADGANGVPG